MKIVNRKFGYRKIVNRKFGYRKIVNRKFVNRKSLYILASLVVFLLTACDKVSPIGVLVSGTAVEDRVKMSHLFYQLHKGDYKAHDASELDEYTFLVGADSHLATDSGRMAEMLQNGLDHNDLLYAHLGDIADTKPEYYILLEEVIDSYKEKYAKKHFMEIDLDEVDASGHHSIFVDTLAGNSYFLDEITYPFYPVVGNHDITHNGWALWSNIFHSSFYDVYVLVDKGKQYEDLVFDHFIFIDTASGTLGQEQVRLINEGVLSSRQNEMYTVRNTFVFSHTNIFRPSSLQFSSTFTREESFFLLDKFRDWDAKIVFCGHVHKWDRQMVGGVEYLTLDSMSERNSPDPGDYLVRVHVKKDGTVTWERVRMNYVAR